MLFTVLLGLCLAASGVLAAPQCENWSETSGRMETYAVGQTIALQGESCVCTAGPDPYLPKEYGGETHFVCNPAKRSLKRNAMLGAASRLRKRLQAKRSWKRNAMFGMGSRLRKRLQTKRSFIKKRAEQCEDYDEASNSMKAYKVGESVTLQGVSCTCRAGPDPSLPPEYGGPTHFACSERKRGALKKRSKKPGCENWDEKKEDFVTIKLGKTIEVDGTKCTCKQYGDQYSLDCTANDDSTSCSKYDEVTEYGNYQCRCEYQFSGIGIPTGKLGKVCRLKGCEDEEGFFVAPKATVNIKGIGDCTCVEGTDPTLMEASTLYHFQCIDNSASRKRKRFYF